MYDDDDDSLDGPFAYIPPSGTIIARTRDVEVADELLYFAIRNNLRFEYSEQPDHLILVAAHPDDAQAIRDFIAAGPFVAGDFEK